LWVWCFPSILCILSYARPQEIDNEASKVIPMESVNSKFNRVIKLQEKMISKTLNLETLLDNLKKRINTLELAFLEKIAAMNSSRVEKLEKEVEFQRKIANWLTKYSLYVTAYFIYKMGIRIELVILLYLSYSRFSFLQ